MEFKYEIGNIVDVDFGNGYTEKGIVMNRLTSKVSKQKNYVVLVNEGQEMLIPENMIVGKIND